MAHPIQHFEVSANDRAAAAAFYTQVFGFTAQDFPEMNYTMVTTGEGSPTIGLNPVSENNPAGQVIPYFTSESVKATLEKASAAGGRVVMESTPIPTVGDVGMFMDPTGNLLGVWRQDNQ
jgi:predicted enzyme related to lactoylglutathione lyase